MRIASVKMTAEFKVFLDDNIKTSAHEFVDNMMRDIYGQISDNLDACVTCEMKYISQEGEILDGAKGFMKSSFDGYPEEEVTEL